jgi:hypothetical protein
MQTSGREDVLLDRTLKLVSERFSFATLLLLAGYKGLMNFESLEVGDVMWKGIEKLGKLAGWASIISTSSIFFKKYFNK